jgi:lipoate-protein ligase B
VPELENNRNMRMTDELADTTALVCDLGLIPYGQAMGLERSLSRMRAEEQVPDILLLMEHPPTVTMGRFGKPWNVLLSRADLCARGVAFHTADRGGDATFHCPGQLILHLVMSLRRRPGTMRAFITDLEEVVLRVLAGYGVGAERWPAHPGLWVGGRQIAALGLHVSRSVSTHGLAFNINPDLSSFNLINLCGLPGVRATSLARETGRGVNPGEVAPQVLDAFTAVFGLRTESISPAALTGLAAAQALVSV